MLCLPGQRETVMFQAVLKGKVRGLLVDAGLPEGVNWRHLIEQTEDFLTAAVFTRLSYLPSKVLWRVVLASAKPLSPAFALPEDAGPLTSPPQFWPRWPLKLVSGHEQPGRIDASLVKEPDVFLQFEHLDLVVEAKRYDGQGQNPDQWAAEVAACLERERDPETDVPVWLLAIGGVDRAEAVYASAVEIFGGRYGYRDTPLRIAACSWATLLTKVIEAGKKETGARPGVNHIIQDIEAVLSFHGFRNPRWVADLASPEVISLRHIDIDQRSSKMIATAGWVERGERQAAALSPPWWEGISGLRGIDARSLKIMGMRT
jgi:hypothetical protein